MTVKGVGELQALLCGVAFQGPAVSLTYLPEFVAKTESEQNLLPHSFIVKALVEFVGDLPEERLLGPVQALRTYLAATASLAPRPHSLFMSPSFPSRSVQRTRSRISSITSSPVPELFGTTSPAFHEPIALEVLQLRLPFCTTDRSPRC